ncbi:MAG: type II secretion system F family protein [Nanoarchaeota archaeon]|nr:type II secretion system F family protein [Nanoarchaeota archaeon]
MKLPKKKSIDPKEVRKKINRKVTASIYIGIFIAAVSFFFNRDLPISLAIWVGVTILAYLNLHFREKLKESSRVSKMEDVFPDFLQLMSSNLRAGITIDRAMLLSAREEFYPLDKEIQKTGRDIATGKEIELSLLEMANRINSPKISKTIALIISGIKSGGDVATLLEETGSSAREKKFVEKKAASNVLMYVIFIFVAVSIGAPGLFALSNILVEVLTEIFNNLPPIDPSAAVFTMSSINISTKFIFYFSILFIISTDILASLILGLVSKGEEKEGLKFLIPLIMLSLSVFFLIKFSLAGLVKGFF